MVTLSSSSMYCCSAIGAALQPWMVIEGNMIKKYFMFSNILIEKSQSWQEYFTCIQVAYHLNWRKSAKFNAFCGWLGSFIKPNKSLFIQISKIPVLLMRIVNTNFESPTKLQPQLCSFSSHVISACVIHFRSSCLCAISKK